jgi:hypothetical protein
MEEARDDDNLLDAGCMERLQLAQNQRLAIYLHEALCAAAKSRALPARQ